MKLSVMLLGVAGLTLVLSACSGPGSKRPVPTLSQDFSTHITADGSKLFVFTLEMQRPDGGRQGAGGPPNRRGDLAQRPSRSHGGKGADSSDRMEKFAFAQLDKKMQSSGYCREGYMVLERYFERGKSRIRGECKEAASGSDRSNFSGLVSS